MDLKKLFGLVLNFNFKRDILLNKKAQGAGAAAVLVAIVAGLMISYVLFVSPEERAELLGEEYVASLDSGGESAGEINGEIILEENPGRIEFLSVDEVEHSLSNVEIYTDQESEIISEKASLYLKNSLFSEEKGTMNVVVDDASLVENVILNFNVETGTGRLTVEFNGEVLFDEEVYDGKNVNVDVSEYLLDEETKVEFSISSPGASFWSSNVATLANLKLVGDVTNLANQKSSSSFLISDTEYSNLETSSLEFQASCSGDENGKVSIDLNNKQIYENAPDCGSKEEIEISLDYLIEGQNEVDFFVEYGNYELYNIKFESVLEDVIYPTYYFSLSHEEFESVEAGDMEVELTLNFAEYEDKKSGYVSVNGDKSHFDTSAGSYVVDISNDVVSGNNAVIIKPSVTVEIRELTVELGN